MADPYQSGTRPGQPASGEPTSRPDAPAQAPEYAPPPAPADMTVRTPTLAWVTIPHTDRHLPIGEDDYVLESYFDPQYGAWEILVLVQPGGEAGDGDAADE